MSHRKCPQCGTPLDFQTMVMALNPFSMPCGGCSQKIHSNRAVMAAVCLVLLVAVYAVWTGLEQLGLTFSHIAVLVFAGFLGLEYVLYLALDRGWLGSNLIAAEQPAFAQSVADTMAAQTRSETAAGTESTAEQPALTPECVLPVIKTTAYQQSLLQRLGASSESLPWSQPLVGDLILTWAMDRDSDRIAVSPASLRQFGLDRQLTQASLATQAERNALAVLRTIRQGQHGPITALSCDNHLMASALLYPELWNQLEQQAGDELVVAVPHRDEIWYVAASDHDAVDALRAELAGYSAPDNHGLSGLLFVREEGEWEVYNDR